MYTAFWCLIFGLTVMFFCVVCSLSSGGNYSDMMPQFLRAVRALCKLYPCYKRQESKIREACPATFAVPTSFPDPFHSGSTVRRTHSIGSLIDSTSVQHSRTQTVPVATSASRVGFRRRGHRRSNSHTLSTEEASQAAGRGNLSVTNGPSRPQHNGHCGSAWVGEGGGGGGGEGGPLEDPFEKLEAVWSSLESWFDLILDEVEKTVTRLPGLEKGGKAFLKMRMQSIDAGEGTTSENSASAGTREAAAAAAASSVISDASGASLTNGSVNEVGQVQDPAAVTEGEVKSKRSKGEMMLGLPPSNQLAAAIVKSTPAERRMAYLRFVYILQSS